MSVWEELLAAARKLRGVPACPEPHACGGCVDSEELASWLDHTADNMQDEQAYEVELQRADGSPYKQVVVDGACHLGLTWEWTAALANARKINAVDLAEISAAEPVVSDAAKEILDVLSGFGSDLAGAVDWVIRLPEVASADGPNAEGEYQVELLDGSVIEREATRAQWVVTVSDDTEAVAG